MSERTVIEVIEVTAEPTGTGIDLIETVNEIASDAIETEIEIETVVIAIVTVIEIDATGCPEV
jgi:hypothetical protein